MKKTILTYMLCMAAALPIHAQLDKAMKMAENMVNANVENVENIMKYEKFKKVARQDDTVIYTNKKLGMGCQVTYVNGRVDKVKMLLADDVDMNTMWNSTRPYEYQKVGQNGNAISLEKEGKHISASPIKGSKEYKYGFEMTHREPRGDIRDETLIIDDIVKPELESPDLHFLGLHGQVRKCDEGPQSEDIVQYMFTRDGRLESSLATWGGQTIENAQRDKNGRIVKYGGEVSDMDGEPNFYYVNWRPYDPNHYVDYIVFDGPCCSIKTVFTYGDPKHPYLVTEKRVITDFPCAKGTEKYEYIKFDDHGNWTQRLEIKTYDEGNGPKTVREMNFRRIQYWKD